MTACSGSFVDAALRQQHTDALFTTEWAGRDAYLYVLLEHQSSPDPLMAFRMLRYQVRIWEQHLNQHPDAATLPVIVPIVIYQGRRRWNVSTQFADLLDVDPDLRDADLDDAALPRFSYLLDDLSIVDAPVLRARPLTEEARMGLVLLGLPAGFQDLRAALGAWSDGFAVIADHPGGQGVLDRVRAECEARGRAEGRTEGQAKLFTDLLTLKFGDLDDNITSAIAAASPEQITAWSARLIEGTLTLDDLTD